MTASLAVYAAKIPPLDDRDILRYAADLPVDRRQKITAYRQRADRLRSLTAGLLLRQVLAPYRQVGGSEDWLQVNEYGKPYWAGRPEVQFNLSHSGEWVVCAVDSQAVGIDIEKIEAVVNMELAKQFFSCQEWRELAALSFSEQAVAFFRLWTHKESYLKALGVGLSKPLNSFTVSLAGQGLLAGPHSQPCFFKEYNLAQGYALTVCAVHNDFPAMVMLQDVVDFNKGSVV